jgi:GH25 family lysozyme M1 (1,4-beta-N-acetylmuramidase)
MILGNDCSKWQGDINFDVYKNNSNFLIFKASEGTGYTDTKFSRNQSECRRVGFPLGYYHFARPDLNNLATAEADWFLKVCWTPVEGEVYILDYEPNWSGDAVAWCKTFLDRVQEKIGVKCFIYLNQSQATAFDWSPVVNAGYPLWIAAYTGSPTKNDFKTGKWATAAMQQWTNCQTVPGIIGDVDGDCFFGDIIAFKKYGYHAPVVIPPTPTPTPTPTPLPDASGEVKALKEKVNELNELVLTYDFFRHNIRDIIWSKGWPWQKISKLKVLLPKQ